jgi:hypothetical protein
MQARIFISDKSNGPQTRMNTGKTGNKNFFKKS